MNTYKAIEEAAYYGDVKLTREQLLSLAAWFIKENGGEDRFTVFDSDWLKFKYQEWLKTQENK